MTHKTFEARGNKTFEARKNGLVVWILKDDQRIGGWAFDVETAPSFLAVLRREFEWRTAAMYPNLAGHPYAINLSLIQGSVPTLQFDVRVDGSEESLPFRVPFEKLRALISGLSSALDVQPPFDSELTVCRETDLVGMGFQVEGREDGFEICDAPRPTLPLGQDFDLQPLATATRQVQYENPIWLDRCVFEAAAFEQFIQGARQATTVERGWLGSARVVLAGGRVTVVIESIDEVIGAAQKAAIRSSGQEVFQMLTKRPGASVYLHTHPRLDGASSEYAGHSSQLHPIPSVPDLIVGETLNVLSRLPVVMPIAAGGLKDEREFRVYTFSHGHLAPVSVEVVV